MNHRHYLNRSSTRHTRRPRTTREAIVTSALFFLGGTRHQAAFVKRATLGAELLRGAR